MYENLRLLQAGKEGCFRGRKRKRKCERSKGRKPRKKLI
jgi:hypothetical protein